MSGLQLIHMRGRVFDPQLGRFHGVDPIIQFPLSSQGLNPYSYILNNPLAGVDPTGYCAAETGTRIKSCAKVTQVMSDGTSRTQSFNLNSAGDMARAGATPIRGLGDNGADSRSSLPKSAEEWKSTADVRSISSRGKSSQTDIPRAVQKSCAQYEPPSGSSCGLDNAIELSAQTRRAGGQASIDPNYANPMIAEHAQVKDGVVEMSIGYTGTVQDALVQDASARWSGRGALIKLSLVRNSQGPLEIRMMSTPEIANMLGICNCETAYRIGGHATENGVITLNSDHARSSLISSLAHELGHVFFGRGHPRVRGDEGFGGIMDYSSRRVNDSDRERFRRAYGDQERGAE